MKKLLMVILGSMVLMASNAFANGFMPFSGAFAQSNSVSHGVTSSSLSNPGPGTTWGVSGSINQNQSFANAATSPSSYEYSGFGQATTSTGSQSLNISGAAGSGQGIMTQSKGASFGRGSAVAGFTGFTGFYGY